jgi:O-methyltransferase.
MYRTWDYLTPALLQGKAQCGPAAAGGFQNYYADGAALALFLKGMTGGSRLVARSLAEKFPWKAHRTVFDIGTAQGCVLVEIAKAHPHLTGGGFDLPNVQLAFELTLRNTNSTAGWLSSPEISSRIPFHTRTCSSWDASCTIGTSL